jgi:hypothetical protein
MKSILLGGLAVTQDQESYPHPQRIILSLYSIVYKSFVKIFMKKTKISVRVVHRYLGFFLVGVLAMYSISGITLIFRRTDTFKKTVIKEITIDKNTKNKDLGRVLEIKDLKVDSTVLEMLYFKGGNFNKSNGKVVMTKKEYPFLLDKMMKLHKATTNSPVYWLNIFFGLSLLFFVTSSFWMFLPKTSTFKKGLIFSILGFLMTILILFL